jgi:hypothetical protein
MCEHEPLSVYGRCGEFAIPERDWRRILSVAQVYGWHPQGTAAPDEDAIDVGLWSTHRNWDGAYFPASGQHITEGDAEALADALGRALRDIPEYQPEAEILRDESPNSEWFADVPPAGVNCLEAFKGIRKELIRAFIVHCREEGGLWLY